MANRAKAFWLLIPATIGVLLVLVFRPSAAPPEPERVPPPPAERPAPPVDPLVRKWQLAIRQHDRAGVEQSSAAFGAREDEWRERLVTLAMEDPDPRVRAFTVTLLASFRKPPPEEVFVRSLGEASEYPRESAIAALLKHGTRACLGALDRVAASDPVERLRIDAARAAQSLRAK